MTIVVFGEDEPNGVVVAGQSLNGSSESEILEIGVGKTVTFVGSLENTSAPIIFRIDMAGDDGVFFETPMRYEPEYPPLGASPAAIPFYVNFEAVGVAKMKVVVDQISTETMARMVCCIK